MTIYKRGSLKLMKKLTAVFMVFLTVISLTIIPAYAETRTVYGRITGGNEDGMYTIEQEIGENISAYADESVNILVGMSAIFTLELRDNTLYIIKAEQIPEKDMEVGYLSRAVIDTLSFDGGVLLLVYADERKEIYINSWVNINGERYSDKDSIYNAVKSYKGAIAYNLNGNGKITKLDFITEPKQSLTNVRYNTAQNTFDGLKYKITDDTNIWAADGKGNVTAFGGFNENYVYSLDVCSYDMENNARFIIIKDMYTGNIGVYIGNERITTPDGKAKNWKAADSNVYDGIEQNDVIEFTYDANKYVRSVTKITGTEFEGLTYDKEGNKLGNYDLGNTGLFDFERGSRVINPDENMQYKGTAYVSEYGGAILSITEIKIKRGAPIINFKATDGGDSLRISVYYEKNGYEGGGKICIAAYEKNVLKELFLYDLKDKESAYNAEYNDTDPVIYERIYGNTSDYTVKGFVWDEAFAPIYPEENVEIY